MIGIGKSDLKRLRHELSSCRRYRGNGSTSHSAAVSAQHKTGPMKS